MQYTMLSEFPGEGWDIAAVHQSPSHCLLLWLTLLLLQQWSTTHSSVCSHQDCSTMSTLSQASSSARPSTSSPCSPGHSWRMCQSAWRSLWSSPGNMFSRSNWETWVSAEGCSHSTHSTQCLATSPACSGPWTRSSAGPRPGGAESLTHCCWEDNISWQCPPVSCSLSPLTHTPPAPAVIYNSLPASAASETISQTVFHLHTHTHLTIDQRIRIAHW